MLLREAIEAFLAGYFSTCRRSEKTRSAYRVDLSQFTEFVGADCTLEAIAPRLLEDWAAHLRSEEYAVLSIRRKFATLRVFFFYWVRREALTASPTWRIRLDLGRELRLPRSLLANDAKRLLQAAWAEIPAGCRVRSADDTGFIALRNLAALEILFATGIRVGELIALRVQDWMEDDATFLVRGKGSRQRLVIMADERSANAVRTYFTQRQSLECDSDALFLNVTGARLSTQAVARVLARLAKAAGLTTRVTPHMIRHTVATLLLRGGADIRVVQELLGHTSITTTQRYTHVTKEHLLASLRAHHPGMRLDIGHSLWT